MIPREKGDAIAARCDHGRRVEIVARGHDERGSDGRDTRARGALVQGDRDQTILGLEALARTLLDGK